MAAEAPMPPVPITMTSNRFIPYAILPVLPAPPLGRVYQATLDRRVV
jgi:hypothetical protein